MGDERFLLLLDTLPYPAFAISALGYAVHYNSRFVEYVGFRPGPTRADRTALHHPDDQPVLEAAREKGVAAGEDYVVELRLRRHDGAYRWHRVHNKPLFRDGRRVAYLGTAVDVHDARLAQEVLERRVQARTAELEAANRRLEAEKARYQDLYNHTPVALHSCDADARLLEVNDTWLEMFGHAREQVIGRSPPDFMTPESARLYRETAWPEMLASNGAVKVADYCFVTAAGRTFDGRLAGRGVFDGTGRLARTWAAIADITAEKRAEESLRRAQRLDAIGQLTSGVAHDFNNLLTAILGGLELAARPGQTEEKRQLMIQGARAAAERGAKLTAQLLAFSRQQRIVVGPVDVNRIVEGMRPFLASTIGEAFSLHVRTASGLPHALGDVTQVELAVLNLAINARDALPGRGSIVIATSLASTGQPVRPEEPPPGSYVAIEVRDDGPGIPEAVQERMFEPFFSTKGVGRGSGLGLAQVLGIVQQIGGGVSVRSAPGQGTTIVLLLPLAGPASRSEPAVPAREAAAPERSLRILLVDDDPAVRSTAATMLREAGHTVAEAASGPAALAILAGCDAAAGKDFDLLLADIVMPDMSGTDLAARVRAARPGMPVLFMTGYAERRELPPDPAALVLPKPFQLSDLQAWLARAVRHAPAEETPAAAQALDNPERDQPFTCKKGDVAWRT